MRHDYSESLASTRPHWNKNFVLCQVFRGDRETPLIIRNIWRECDTAAGASRDGKVHGALFVIFARRVFHNYPPSSDNMQAWLPREVLQPSFDPSSASFGQRFETWAEQRAADGMYGRASHWFCPGVNDERGESAEGIGWFRGSLSLLRKFWGAVPFLHMAAATGPLHSRAWAVSALLGDIGRAAPTTAGHASVLGQSWAASVAIWEPGALLGRSWGCMLRTRGTRNS